MKTDFTTAAEADLQKVVESYEQLRIGIGDRILQELRRIVLDIEQFPESYPLVSTRLRRANVSLIPFQLYYAVRPSAIPVLGIFPSRMYPKTKHRILNRRLAYWDTSDNPSA